MPLNYSYTVLHFLGETYPIRLAGNDSNGGIVEVSDGYDLWGRIGTLSWTLVEAEVVCRHMGYLRAVAAMRYSSEDAAPPKIMSLKCATWYTPLHECVRDITVDCACDAMDAGVVCSNSKKSFT